MGYHQFTMRNSTPKESFTKMFYLLFINYIIWLIFPIPAKKSFMSKAI